MLQVMLLLPNTTVVTDVPCSDLLEDISRTIKKEKLQLKTDTLVVGIVCG